MKKLYPFLLLMSIALIVAGLCPGADAEQKHYSIQIKAVPLSEQRAGFVIYNDLKRKGYLVYYYQAKIKGESWMRLRVGVFPTMPQAQAFGENFKNKEGFDVVVTKADVHIDPYKHEYEIITTPSAVWMRKGSTNKELYRYSGYKIYTADKHEDTKVLISRDGKECEFNHDFFTYTVNVTNGKKYPFQRKGAYKVHSEAQFPSENRLVRIVADSTTYDQKRKEDKYNKILILEHRSRKKVLKSIMMQAHPAFVYSHFISHAHNGKTKFVVIQGRSAFYVYDVILDNYSGAIVPHHGQEVIGVDGRSGSLSKLKLSKDGRTLTGTVIHSGQFAYDLTVPGKPKRIYFNKDMGTDG